VSAYLEVASGRAVGRRYRVDAAASRDVVIGREAACEVAVFDEAASRRHTALRVERGHFMVRDLSSRNGTFLNAAALKTEARLRSGDELRIGDTVLRFMDEREVRVETKPAALSRGMDGFRVESAVQVTGAAGKTGSRGGPDRAVDWEDRLRALLQFGRQLGETGDPDALADLALRLLPDVLVADRAAVYLQPAGAAFDLSGVRVGPSSAQPPSAALLERALAGDEALLLSRGLGDEAARLLGRESVVREGVCAVMAAPIAAGRTRGVVYVDRLQSRGRFREADLMYLADVARQLGAALRVVDRTEDARAETEGWRRLAMRRGSSPRTRGHTGHEDPEAEPTLIVGQSSAIREAIALCDRAAESELAVLVTGETGVGKELFARRLHERSPRRSGPFVPVNCAAFAETLLESELFGCERGAFTGADRRRKGLFELASGGTLFLDELGEMPESLQARLLRVLEAKQVRRLGGQAQIPVDVRVVAATNRNLKEEVVAGHFREDLFYRLCVIQLVVPPLRERREDVPRIAEHLLAQVGFTSGFTADALVALQGHDWPGNVRELRNAVERAVALSGGAAITRSELGLQAAASATRAAKAASLEEAEGLLPITIAEAERRAVIAALRHTAGKKAKAAKLLGIAHPTLNRKIRDYGIE
jgi:Nif-specific regulatory protein